MLNKCYLLIAMFFNSNVFQCFSVARHFNSNVLKQMPNMFQKSEAWLFLKKYFSEHVQIQETESCGRYIHALN